MRGTSFRKISSCLLLFALVVGFSAAAAALDIEDVKSLIRNQVGEEVIINMANTDTRLFITYEEAEELRRMGASENLITALRPRPTSWSPGAVAPAPSSPAPSPSAPTVVTSGTPPAAAGGVVTGTVIEETVEIDQGAPITMAPIVSAGGYPPRYDKEGWLSISNHDWIPYYLNINQGDKRIFISKVPNGGMAVQSGQNIIVNLRKNTYKTYGDSGEKLEVKIRENETSSLNLNPFGVVGNSGLTGVAISRDKVRSEVLFNNYSPAPAVIVQEPSVIVVQPEPPPVYYYRPPYYRPYRDGVYFHYRRW